MTSDFMKRLGLQESALSEAARSIEPFRNIIKEQANIIAPARSIFEEINDTLLLTGSTRNGIDLLGFSSGRQIAQSLIHNFGPDFTLPGLFELNTIFGGFDQSRIADIIQKYQLQADVLRTAISSMRSPWLDLNDQLNSVSGLTELHGIGHALSIIPSFDEELVQALRIDLGDWRGDLQFDYGALLDVATRSEYYVARGFDPNLTAFPAPAFREGMISAGLIEQRPPDADDDEAHFMLTNEAHDRLMRFEHHVRIFIDKAMTKAFGKNWTKQRISGPMSNAWQEKKAKGLASGDADLPLIVYADFTDYLEILIQNNNWKEVFEVYFRHKPSVQESFRRLFPVRICVMHSRTIGQDDSLFLLVEIKRLASAMGFAV